MAQLNNAKTAYAKLQGFFSTLKGEDLRREGQNIIWALAGPDQRFDRQELMELITGEKLPLVKCGVNALWDAAKSHFNAKPSKVAEPETAPKKEAKGDIPLEVGLEVIRHCGTVGKITGVNTQFRKVIVELSNGSVRKPSFKRFQQLYSLPNPNA